MAPPTGSRGGTNNSTRNTRSSTAASRGPSRGGISKRSRGGARIDRDGDLVMDPSASGRGNKSGASSKSSAATNRRGTTRSSAPSSRATASSVRQNLERRVDPRAKYNVTLKITGVKSSKAAANPDGGVESLMGFLERKAGPLKGPGPPVTIKKSSLQGDFVYITLRSEDADAVLKLNGFVFALSNLTIEKEENGIPGQQSDRRKTTTMSTQAQQDKLKLQGVLERRYNPDAKLLDLSALALDPVLAELGLFQEKAMAEKTFKVLMVICDGLFKTAAEKREAIQSITLASNGLNSAAPVFDLAETFPELMHLDLSNNSFSSMKQLSRWRGRFRRLQTLLLNGNPIMDAEPNHGADAVSWFPKLLVLNEVQIRTPEQIAAAEAATTAKPIRQRGTDFRDVKGLGENFLKTFFQMYDSDRNALLAFYYDAQSTFTLAVATKTPKENDTVVLPWAAYLKFSRNQAKITTQGARVQRYFEGVQIQELWKALPATKHPDILAQVGQYLVDAHPMNAIGDPTGQNPRGVDGMIITVHGEFEEFDVASSTTGKRSFTRTFVLSPALPGSNAPIRVSSDMLSLRAWSPVPSLAPASDLPTPPVVSVVAAPAPVPAAMSPEEQQQMMVVELSNRTNMKFDFSKLCLTTAGWDFDRALLVFEEKRSVLPPDAFN